MNNIESIIRPNILALKPYSSARDEFTGKEGIFLDANENPYGKFNRYPDPYQKELKQKLAQIKTVLPNNIFIGNGSDEIIDLAFRIFCNPGIDKAITFSPTYGMYDVSASINHIELIKIPLNQDFQIDLKALNPYFKDSSIKLIFICSPNNPTGNLMNKKDIEYILKQFKGLVIIDEAYIDFAEADSLISLINEYHNLIISQTFSKAWGLASARVGIAFAQEKIIRYFNKIKPPYNISGANQKIIIEALEKEKTFQSKSKNVNNILKEKYRLENELNQIPFIRKIYPSDANFLLIQVENANHLYHQLIQKKIITRNRNSQVTNCLRISIGTPEENNQLINTLKNLS